MGVEASSSVGMMMKNYTAATILLLLLLVTTTYCQRVSASPSMAPAATAPTTAVEPEDGGVLYMVGQPVGWFIIPGCGNLDFQAWAEYTTFHPGDVLYFHYPDNHDSNVIQVSRQDYETCTLTSPLAMYTSGEDYIRLREEGDFYFVSGAHDYCQYQKIHVRVVPRTTSATPPHSSSSMPPVASSAPASYVDYGTSSATSIKPTQRMSRWVVFGLSLLVVIAYV